MHLPSMFALRGLMIITAIAFASTWLLGGTRKPYQTSLFDTDKLVTHFDFLSHDDPEIEVQELKPQVRTRASYLPKGQISERGAQLMHSWTDEELFQRAVKADKQYHYLQSLKPFDGHEDPKIAFMFISQGDLPLGPLWAKFLQGNEDRHNIYVHLDKFQPSALKGMFWGRAIPSEPSEPPTTTGLVVAARRLMANAILDDPLNEWFALISDGCIPLHNFGHTYKALESTNKSFVEINDRKQPLLWYRYVARGQHVMEPEVTFSDFKMGSKWWIMRKKHALMMISDRVYWRKFNLPCLPLHKMCCPEEHYFSTVLSILDRNGSTGKGVTFVDGRVGLKSKTYLCSNINQTFFHRLQSRDKGRWLFARKFNPKCLEKLIRAYLEASGHQNARLPHDSIDTSSINPSEPGQLLQVIK